MLFFLFLLSLFVAAARSSSNFYNQTVDDASGNPMLSWNDQEAQWDRWTGPDQGYFFHSTCVGSSVFNARATFNFTGTAVYYYAALWGKRSNVKLCLDTTDSSKCDIVDLEDHSSVPRSNFATQSSDVRWFKTGLANENHTVTVMTDDFAIVDAFVYTTDGTVPSSKTEQNATLSTGELVGIAIGSIVCASLVVFTVLLYMGKLPCLRQRSHSSPRGFVSVTSKSAPPVTPFLQSYPTSVGSSSASSTLPPYSPVWGSKPTSSPRQDDPAADPAADLGSVYRLA